MKLKKLILIPLKYIRPVLWARLLGVKVGENCRFYKISFSTEPYLVTIGNHVSATKVHFETHDGGVWVFREQHPSWDIIRRICIGDNVYIGYDTIIMPGVNIGDNVIIGAKSLVTKSFPSNVVIGGVPAKIIKTKDQYYEKVMREALSTKTMNPVEKKQFLEQYFQYE
ncbi:acyltransferase [Niabella sp. CC-SYL272]|uniref:acyltransferase n=1 Tax=Niabella agricola TaxID=2891571 RepID=UPI001F19CC45|nr:acyltransferase [Niabella agricola]MCF3112121.1 acyltransferase [Niabella agricola]